MTSIRRSNSSRNRTADRTLRSATRRQLRRHPCCAAGWKLTDLGINRPIWCGVATDLLPSDRLHGTRIKVPNSQSDLASPRLFGVFIDLRVEAVNERVGECRPCCRGKIQSVLEQFRCVLSHVAI